MARKAKCQPTCYVVAGPNGAGKTTYAMTYLPEIVKGVEFVNADMIARGISPLNEESVQVKAGKVFLERLHELARQKRDFAFETTLAGLAHAAFLRKLKKNGYFLRLYYLWIPSVNLSAKRVATRVEQGGHNIPLPVIKRRFNKSLRNLVRVYLPIFDYTSIVDNSSTFPTPIMEQTEETQIIFQQKRWSSIKEHVYAKET